MTRAAAMRANPRTDSDGQPLSLGYLRKSQAPLTCLVFLLPLLVLYEVGMRYFASDLRPLRAFDYMLRMFHLFGASGKYLPALAVAMILLVWHIARNDPWELDLGTTACMALESVALSLPLFVMDTLCKTYVPLRAGHHVGGELPEMIVLSLGAGIYEELVFRLGAFTLLSILLVDVLRMRRGWSVLLMVVASAIIFAQYHYQEGGESFSWQTFAFRTGAGIYFGGLFLFRGFGITSGTHAAYDIIAVLLPAFTTR